MTFSRRDFFSTAFGGAAAAGLGLVIPGAGCGGARPSGADSMAPTVSHFRIDDTFARALLESSPPSRDQLLESPALAALVRHARLAGQTDASTDTILDRIVAATIDADGARRVLAAWQDRDAELVEYARAALDYLPHDTQLETTVFLAVGYDIGVAAPPDVVINVAHEHFVNTPSELSHYLTHEVHHVGFLAHRAPPKLANLTQAEQLVKVIRFFTQLEGLAVHAALPGRRLTGALHSDSDYLVYYDDQAAAEVVAQYAQAVAELAGRTTVEDSTVGRVLEAMSSDKRLWYRFGAIVCERIEQDHDRAYLIDTVIHPERFDEAAQRLTQSV